MTWNGERNIKSLIAIVMILLHEYVADLALCFMRDRVRGLWGDQEWLQSAPTLIQFEDNTFDVNKP